MDWVAVLAVASVVAYQLNGHVLKYTGKLNAVDPVTLVWLLHIVICFLAPYAYWKHQSLVKQMKHLPMTGARFLFAVTTNTCLQMAINYFWLLSSQAIPVQLTSAIYQTAIGFVYICSVLLLGEKIDFWKSVGVAFAIAGVFLSSYFPPLLPGVVAGAANPSPVATQYSYGYGVGCAFVALGSKVVSQLFCKIQLNGASSEFMLLYNIHMGLNHVYFFLPVMLAANAAGVPNMSMRFDTTWPAIPCVLLGATICSFVNFGYQCVPVVRSPLFLCRFQVLGVVVAVVLDYAFYGLLPQFLGYCGYSLILASFVLVSGVVDLSSSAKKKTV